MEEKIKEAVSAELERQAEVRPDELRVQARDEMLTISGTVDLGELVAAIAGSVAGGP